MKQVVNFLFFFLCTFNLASAQTIQGTFVEKVDNKTKFAKSVKFKNDYSFTGLDKIITVHGEYNAYNKYYLIRNDTLILFYEKSNDPNPSQINILQADTIQRRINDRKHLRMNLRVKYVDGDYAYKMPILLMKNNSISSVLLTDEKGNVYVELYENVADKILIQMLSYKSAELDLDKFWGLESFVEVVLNEITSNVYYNGSNQIEKYLIKKKGEKIIGFTSLNGNEVFELMQ